MNRRMTKLPGVRACALRECLQAMIDAIEQCSGPHRPLIYSLTARKAVSTLMHPGVEPKDGQIYLMYSHMPSPALPRGRAVLAIGAKPPGGCTTTCCGLCTGDLEIIVWQDASFPFDEEEVNCFIADYFELYDHEWTQLDEKVWQDLRVYFGEPAHARAPAPPEPGKPGAPPLLCNVWLLDTVDLLEDPAANGHLESEYLRRHYAEKGLDLITPHRSFEKAAARCVKIVQARRRRKAA